MLRKRRGLGELWGAAALLFVLGACAAKIEEPAPDLPVGWEAALRVDNLIQEECSGSALGLEDGGVPQEAVQASGDMGAADIEYDQAHFRCEQPVEAFYKLEHGGVDVLVQPVDMNPTSVAGCDCLYKVSMTIEPLDSGETAVNVYRRWDNLNDPNDPKFIGSDTVVVE